MTKRGQHSISAICQNTFLDLVQDLSTSVKRTEPRVLGHHVLYILYALGAPRGTRDATRATLGAQRATLCATPPNWQQLSPEPIRICQCKKERCTEGDRIAWFADNSQEQSQFAHLAIKWNAPLRPPPPPPPPPPRPAQCIVRCSEAIKLSVPSWPRHVDINDSAPAWDGNSG